MSMIFILLKAWTETKFDMVSSIYITLAKVYDILIDLVTPKNGNIGFLTDESLLNLSGMMDTIYVLAGIFMLFKVTVAALQLLLDPDKMTSGNTTPGKIITRVVTSLALLILLVPSGIVFGDNGWARRLESAIINSIPKMIDNQYKSDSDNLQDADNEIELLETVNASKTEQVCYFLHSSVTGHVDSALKNAESKVNQKYTLAYSVEGVYLVKFYKGSTGAADEVKMGNYSYVSLTQGKKYTYKALPGKITGVSDDFVVGGTIKCPKSLVPMNDGTLRIATFSADPSKGVAINGYSSYADYQKALQDLSNKNNSELFKNPTETTLNNVDASNAGTDSAQEILDHLYAFNLNHDEAQDFAISVAKSFQQCNTSTDECDAAQANMFVAPDTIIELIDNDQIKIDTLTSIVVGIVIIVYLLFLCVEVIIRRFKLMLLEMISPLPIISYADPNDKHFSEWIKMYVSVYIDLFLKLFAIKMTITLMDIIIASLNDDRLLVHFFYIVALLLFAKAVPDMLSKIFGIQMSGSFKDIFGMGKKVLGFGAKAVGKTITAGATLAGAGIGAYAGVKTAQGLGNKVVAGFKGFARGAGSGSQKNIYGGAGSITAENAQKNILAENGFTRADIVREKFMRNTGLGGAYEIAKKEKSLQDNYLNMAKDEEDASLKAVDQIIGLHNQDKVASVKALVEAKDDVNEARINGYAKRFSITERTDSNGVLIKSYFDKMTEKTTEFRADTVDENGKHVFTATQTENMDQLGKRTMTQTEAESRIYGLERKAAAELTYIALSKDEARIKDIGLDVAGTNDVLVDRFNATEASAKKAGHDSIDADSLKGLSVKEIETRADSRKSRQKNAKSKSNKAQVEMEKNEVLNDYVSKNSN